MGNIQVGFQKISSIFCLKNSKTFLEFEFHCPMIIQYSCPTRPYPNITYPIILLTLLMPHVNVCVTVVYNSLEHHDQFFSPKN